MFFQSFLMHVWRHVRHTQGTPRHCIADVCSERGCFHSGPPQNAPQCRDTKASTILYFSAVLWSPPSLLRPSSRASASSSHGAPLIISASRQHHARPMSPCVRNCATRMHSLLKCFAVGLANVKSQLHKSCQVDPTSSSF